MRWIGRAVLWGNRSLLAMAMTSAIAGLVFFGLTRHPTGWDFDDYPDAAVSFVGGLGGSLAILAYLTT